MAAPELVLDHLRRSVVAAPLTGLADGELLRRFDAGGGIAEAAFEVLVRRHGPMVLRVCRSALREPHAADDAFQAVFLVLVKKRPAVPARGSLGPWLFGVARRVCDHARRSRLESRLIPTEVAPRTASLEPDVAAAVHAEVGRLPEQLRAAVVLCDLGGLSYPEAADRLGVPHATVRGRVARARSRLRRRFAKLGIGPEGLGGAAVAVPAALATATARAALVVGGMATGAVSAPVLELVTGGLTSMILTKLKTAGFSTLAAGVLIAGALSVGAQTAAPVATTPAIAQAAPEDPVATRVSPLRLRTADPTDAIQKLLAEAKDRQAAGDAKGARQVLRKLHAVVFEWEDQLADGPVAAPARGVRTTEVRPA